ncbi:MAG: hypothetical protein LBQ31_03485 [Bacteroidales bacterium]|jgi:hypothetical protein|nr:hypothetical protein [Bacteroidales bacterium]
MEIKVNNSPSAGEESIAVAGNENEVNKDSKNEPRLHCAPIAEQPKKESLKHKIKTVLPKWVYWVWLISIVAIGLSIAAIFTNYSIKCNVEVVSTSIILAFVGIIATFIVVSNYAQVKDIKDDTAEKIKKMNEDYNNFQKERISIRDDIDDIKAKLEQRKQPSDFLYGFWINREECSALTLRFYGYNGVDISTKNENEDVSEYSIISYDDEKIVFKFHLIWSPDYMSNKAERIHGRYDGVFYRVSKDGNEADTILLHDESQKKRILRRS